MGGIILNQFEKRRSVRKVEKRKDGLYLQCTVCIRMKHEKKFQRDIRSLVNRASQCIECQKKYKRRKHHRIAA
jgi:hypothetical protein